MIKSLSLLLLSLFPTVAFSVAIDVGGLNVSQTPVATTATPPTGQQLVVQNSMTVLKVCNGNNLEYVNKDATNPNIIESANIAIGIIKFATSDVISTGPANPGTNPGSQVCKNTDPKNTDNDGILLNGLDVIGLSATGSGSSGILLRPAQNSYTTSKAAIGNDDGTATYNAHIDANPISRIGTALSSGAQWNVSGIKTTFNSNPLVFTRVAVAAAKSFNHMKTALPNYLVDWQVQMAEATAAFDTAQAALLATLGLNFSNPLPADYNAQINAALAVGQTTVNANVAAAAAAAAAAANASGAALAVAQNNTGAALQTALTGLSVPANLQPLLDQILANIAGALIAMVDYNVAIADITAITLQINNNNAAIQAAVAANAAIAAEITRVTNLPGFQVDGTRKTQGAKRLAFNNARASTLNGLRNSFLPVPSPVSKQAVLDAAILKRDSSLTLANSLNGKVQTDFSLLQTSVAATAATATAAQGTLLNAAATAAQGNVNTSQSATDLSNMANLISDLGLLISGANAVVNLTNVTTLQDVVKAGADMITAFDMVANIDQGLSMGDSIATDTDIINAGTNITGINASVLSTSSLSMKGKKDTPYRALLLLKGALSTIRTSLLMMDLAVRNANFGVYAFSNVPEDKNIFILTDNGDMAIRAVTINPQDRVKEY